MSKSKKVLKIMCLVLVLIILAPILVLLCFTDNKHIDFSTYDINYKEEATQIRIMHLSDMHFPKCEVDLDIIINKVSEEHVDIIAITGDLIDVSANVSDCGVIQFLERLKDFDNVYYVNGNHESNNKEYAALKEQLQNNNIKILENSYEEIEVKGKNISIMGLNDGLDYSTSYFEGIDTNTYKVLLAHRAEKFVNYTSSTHAFNPDVILTGHAHGGQVRIGNMGLVAPNQGLNPEYSNGVYTTKDGKVSMVVSRGIGNSILPLRINNKPHVPIVSLYL